MFSMNAIVQIYICIPQSHFLSNSGNSFPSTVISIFSCLPLQPLTFFLLLPTDPIRYFAASCNSPAVSSHVSGLPLPLLTINSFCSSCLQANWFPEPEVRGACFWVQQHCTADEGAAVRGEIHPPPAPISLADMACLQIRQFSNTPTILHRLCW